METNISYFMTMKYLIKLNLNNLQRESNSSKRSLELPSHNL